MPVRGLHQGAAVRRVRALALAAALALASAGSKEGPNFLFLLADDYGWGDPSPPLGVGVGLTPNLNEMAVAPGAVHFPRSYIGGSVCSPSRASILSGRSPSRDCVITVEQVALPLQLQGDTLADVAAAKGYATAFFGKWHLGSLSNSTAPASCYVNATGCFPGYVRAPGGLCCDGRDAGEPRRTPLDFGFRAAFATAQVAPSATSNCGCLGTVPGAGVGCEMGHYAGAGHVPAGLPGLECDQTYYTRPGDGAWAPFAEVTGVDDAAMLVDRLEAFVLAAVQADAPFLAQVSFHQTHIPYISPPEFRALYPNATLNEQDYYGAASAMDAQVGRVRRLLADLGLAHNTLVAFSADNGPEVSDAGGHSCTPFPNPGVTGSLQGRKRAQLEGGIRVTGIVEAPWLVSRANGGAGGPLRLGAYAQSHVDYLPTVLDLLNATRAHAAWPLDGASLVPALTGGAAVRPGPLGWLADFPLAAGNATCPPARRLPPSAPADFSTPADQPQVTWMEGGLKLVACRTGAGWHFRLFDVDADAGEADDLFAARVATADAMFGRLQTWLASVNASRVNESECAKQ